jgi:pimeloyl-ACP methyl ester carboxylesterase
MTILFSFARWGLAFYVGICVVAFLWQRSLLYMPTPAPGEEADDASRVLPVEGEKLRISTVDRDGSKAVIYFGGNAESVDGSLPDFAALFPEHAIYLMNYRGYGGSSGRPSEAALHRDAQALHDLVRSRHAEITVIGRSLGSGVAVRLAAANPIDRLVLITPFDSILNVAKGTFPFLPLSLLLMDKYESWRYADQVSAPTLILVAEQDEIIPWESTQSLYRAFEPGVAELQVISRAGHNDISGFPEFVTALRAVAQPQP